MKVFKEKLLTAYKGLKIGNPLEETSHLGSLIDKEAVDTYFNSIQRLKEEGGTVLFGGELFKVGGNNSDCYVVPCVAEVENNYKIVQEETFALLLYLIRYNNLDEALELHNNVPQGLSSVMFWTNLLETEKFLSYAGSD